MSQCHNDYTFPTRFKNKKHHNAHVYVNHLLVDIYSVKMALKNTLMILVLLHLCTSKEGKTL